MIFEAILGVFERDGEAGENGEGRIKRPRFAPMGVEADDGLSFALIRPYFSSRTGRALLSSGSGTLNFADDALLFAQTALTDEAPPSRGTVLDGVPYWWDISVVSSGRDACAPRWLIRCRVDKKNFARPFSPFNRARNAVLEAVILATRFGLDGWDEKKREKTMETICEMEAIAAKTGGKRELHAFELIRTIIG
jgi:hypothetical protein